MVAPYDGCDGIGRVRGLEGAPVKPRRVIGLTGNIGSGKSTVAKMLGELGAEVIDADRVARDVVKPSLPAYDEIVDEFGEGVLAEDRTIDRKALGARVFGDPVARRRLEAITHPRIAMETQRRIGASKAPIVVYEATLLVENGIHRGLDGLIVVTAPESQQVARVVARDGLRTEEVERRLAAQLPEAQKVAEASWVIHNEGSLDDLQKRVEAVWKEIHED
jgi:dephospho-CoA kinase